MATKLPYEAHPYAAFFPLDEGPPLWELSERIKKHGLRRAIVLYQGKILDGRRRQLACHRAGVKPKYVEFKGDDLGAINFVEDENYHRRMLGSSDRAICAARILKARQEVEAQNCAPAGEAQNCAPEVTQRQVAETYGVSRRSVQMAAKVLDHGTPELQQAVEEHVVSVSDAAKIADEPPKVQRAAVAKVKAGKANTASGAVKPPKTPKVRGDKPARCPTCKQPWGFERPTVDQVADYAKELGAKIDASQFIDYYQSNGWSVGKKPMRDWKATVRNWARNDQKFKKNGKPGPDDPGFFSGLAAFAAKGKK